MAIRSLSEAVDNLYTTTWYNMKKKAIDNIFDGSPFWFWLKSNGGLQSTEGGRHINEPIRYASSDKIKWITKGGTTSLSDQEFLTTAYYTWKYLTDSIVRFGTEEQQNRGKNQIMSLMQAKIDNSKDSLANELETRLCTSAGTNQMLGLVDIVAAGTLAGIAGGTYTWWQSTVEDNNTDSWATYFLVRFSNLFNDASKGVRLDAPDIIVSGQEFFERYEIEVADQLMRTVNKKMSDRMFEHVVFKGAPVIWSPAMVTDDAYILNTRYLKFRYDPQMFFDMTAWKEIPNQVQDRAAQIVTACELTTSRRRAHAASTSWDTD